MNHVTLVGEVEGTHQLVGEPAHERGRQHVLSEPDDKGPQVFSHEIQHEAYVATVGALELEVVDEVADVFVAHQFAVSGAEVSEDLPLEDGMVLAITLGTQDFESPESVLIIRPARYRPSYCEPGNGTGGA